MKQRIRAFTLAIWFALSVVVPVKHVGAAVPLVGLAVAAISNTGAVVTADLLTSGVTALIGGTIAALAITPNNADAPMRVPLASDKPTIDAAMPPPVVSPVADPVVTGGLPSNASSVLAAWCTVDYSGLSCGAVTSLAQCVADYSQGFSGRSCQVTTVGDSNYGKQYGACANCVSTLSTSSCPAGYASSGSGCSLTDARAVVSDGKADLSRSGASFSVNPAEKDALPSYARVSGGKVYAQGKNSSGQPVMIEYSVSPDGSKTYVTHYTQTEDASQTVVKSQSITVDSSGAVTNAGASSAVGSIAPATGAASVPAVATGAAVTSGAGANSQPIVFPTDYARVGEAALAASAVTAKLDTVKNAVDSLKEAPTVENPVINTPTLSGAQDTFYGNDNKVVGLLGWHVPGFTAVCPTADINFDWKEFSYYGRFESHCSYAEQFRATAATIFDAFWVIVAFFIVLGA